MMGLSLYDRVKDGMASGDLIQWGAHDLLGAIIQRATHSDVSHSSLVIRLTEYEGLERRRFTTEALRHGVVLNLLSRRLEHHTGSAWWYPLKDEWNDKRQTIGERALSFVGIPYDFKSIAKFLFTRVSADARTIFCSELAYICYGFQGEAPAPGDMPGLGIFKDAVRIL